MNKEQRLIGTIMTEKDGRRVEEAYLGLCNMHSIYLLNFVKKSISDERDAKEIVQDVFMSVFKWVRNGKMTYGSSIRPVLTTSAINLIRANWKRKQIIYNIENADKHSAQPPEIEREIETEHIKHLIKKLMVKLNPKQQEAFLLYSYGYSHKEIADIVGWETDKTSRKEIYLIRKYLRKNMDPKYFND